MGDYNKVQWVTIPFHYKKWARRTKAERERDRRRVRTEEDERIARLSRIVSP